MKRSVVRAVAGLCCVTAAPVLAFQSNPVVTVKTVRPGGRFLERLEQAKKTLDPTPAAPSAPRSGTSRSRRSRPVYRAYRPAAPVRRWAFKSTNLDGVTYAVTPRSSTAKADKRTGDVILIAEPEGQEVFFYISGGSQLKDMSVAVLKGRKPTPAGKDMYVMAIAPSLGGRAHAFVPVKAGQITTVRFKFEGQAAKKVTEPDAVQGPVSSPAGDGPAVEPKAPPAEAVEEPKGPPTERFGAR
jgi:hypothetical protein